MEPTTDIVEEKPKRVPNPTGKGGFGERPEDIQKGGAWNSRNTISYQYRRFMSMTEGEIAKWLKETPQSEITVAEQIAFAQVNEARKNKSLPHTKEITDRTEGKARETVIWTGELNGTLNVKAEDDGTLASRIRQLVKSTEGAEAGSDSDSGRTEPPQSQPTNA